MRYDRAGATDETYPLIDLKELVKLGEYRVVPQNSLEPVAGSSTQAAEENDVIMLDAPQRARCGRGGATREVGVRGDFPPDVGEVLPSDLPRRVRRLRVE